MQVIEFPAASTFGTVRNNVFAAHARWTDRCRSYGRRRRAIAMGFLAKNSARNSTTRMSSVARPKPPRQCPFLEIHTGASWNSFPIQEIEDQSVIYSKPAVKRATLVDPHATMRSSARIASAARLISSVVPRSVERVGPTFLTPRHARGTAPHPDAAGPRDAGRANQNHVYQHAQTLRGTHRRK